MVVANATMRANAVNVEMPDVARYSQTASPYSESISYATPMSSDAFFKQKELKLLGFKNIDGSLGVGVLRGVRRG